MTDDYYEKYLKYKDKYLKLKAQICTSDIDEDDKYIKKQKDNYKESFDFEEKRDKKDNYKESFDFEDKKDKKDNYKESFDFEDKKDKKDNYKESFDFEEKRGMSDKSDKSNKSDKFSQLCHNLDKETCQVRQGCTSKYDKNKNFIGCKQKHCWGRNEKFCQNVKLDTKSKSLFGTTGCEYDKKEGCRMKCDGIDEKNCNKLNECIWNGYKCSQKENPCRAINKTNESSQTKLDKCKKMTDDNNNKLCKIQWYSQKCIPITD